MNNFLNSLKTLKIKFNPLFVNYFIKISNSLSSSRLLTFPRSKYWNSLHASLNNQSQLHWCTSKVKISSPEYSFNFLPHASRKKLHFYAKFVHSTWDEFLLSWVWIWLWFVWLQSEGKCMRRKKRCDGIKVLLDVFRNEMKML